MWKGGCGLQDFAPVMMGMGRRDGNGFKGYYLVGVSAKAGGDVERKKILTGKVLTAVREFEMMVREVTEIKEANGNLWVGMDIIPKKKVLEMGLVVDERDWSLTPSPQAVRSPA